MATYCYKTRSGQVIERQFPVGQAPSMIRVKNEDAKRSLAAELRTKTVPARNWPLECVASGVSPEQSGALAAHLEAKGVPTEVSRNGNPIYRDAHHRQRALRARGLFDKDSYN